MAPVIEAEILHGDGEVLATTRHPAPVVVGSSDRAGLRLQGEGVAPEHLEASVSTGGKITLRQLDPTHTTFVGALSLTTAEVASPVVVAVGSVQVRLSLAEAAAPATDSGSSDSEGEGGGGRLRAWSLFLTMLALTAVVGYATDYTDSPGEEAANIVLGAVILTLFWAGAWAVGNRVFGYPLSFSRHLEVTVVGAVVFAVLAAVESLVLASVQLSWLGSFLNWTIWGVWGIWFFGAHMSVPGAWKRGRVLLVAGAVYYGMLGLGSILPSSSSAAEQVQLALRPIGYLPTWLIRGVPASTVSSDADALLREVDDLPATRTVQGTAPET